MSYFISYHVQLIVQKHKISTIEGGIIYLWFGLVELTYFKHILERSRDVHSRYIVVSYCKLEVKGLCPLTARLNSVINFRVYSVCKSCIDCSDYRLWTLKRLKIGKV